MSKCLDSAIKGRRKMADRPFTPSRKVPRLGRVANSASKSRTASSSRPKKSLVQRPFVRRPIVCIKLIRQPKLKSNAEAEGSTATLPSSKWPPNQVYSPLWSRHRSSVSCVTKPTLTLRSTNRLCSSSSKKQRKLHSCRGASSRGSSQRPKLASRRPGQEARPLLPHLKIFARGRKRPTKSILAVMMSAPSAQPANPRSVVVREKIGASTSKMRMRKLPISRNSCSLPNATELP